MAMPSHVAYLIVGAGIHGLSTAWRLAQRLTERGEAVAVGWLSLTKPGLQPVHRGLRAE